MKNFDLNALQFSTSVANEAIERRMKAVRNCDDDYSCSDRLSKRKCRFCYYFLTGGMGVDSKFTYSCCGCGLEHNGYGRESPRLCIDCSMRFDACKMCGADIDLNDRRKVLERKKK